MVLGHHLSFLYPSTPIWEMQTSAALNHEPSFPKTVSPSQSNSSSLPIPPPSSNTPSESSFSKTTILPTSTMANSTSTVSVVRKASPRSEASKPSKSTSQQQ